MYKWKYGFIFHGVHLDSSITCTGASSAFLILNNSCSSHPCYHRFKQKWQKKKKSDLACELTCKTLFSLQELVWLQLSCPSGSTSTTLSSLLGPSTTYSIPLVRYVALSVTNMQHRKQVGKHSWNPSALKRSWGNSFLSLHPATLSPAFLAMP